MAQTPKYGAALLKKNVSPPLGLAQISSGSHRSERVVNRGSAHEPRVVYGQDFLVRRPLGGGSAFDTWNHVEADYHQLAACVLL